jgi:RNA polymerase sigma-70 factor (ECF subfamily)
MIEAASKAHPLVAADPARFEDHVLARAPPDAEALARLHAADLWLAFASAEGDAAALRAFDESCLLPISSQLHSTRTPPEELRQALRERLLVAEPDRPPRIAAYAGRGPLASWVRVAALRLLVNLERGASERRQAEGDLGSLAVIDPEVALLKARYKSALEQSLRLAFSTLEPQERTLLRQYFVESLSIDRLAPLYGIGRSTAARRLASARARLLRETMRALRQTHAIAGHEVKSLLHLVRSQLQLSLASLMR